MRVLLTSCGLETKKLEKVFLDMLGKDSSEATALFIPVAATDAGAIAVLPKCMNDLLKVGISENNVTVFDMHCNMTDDEIDRFDVVYLCGGRTQYLLDRINDTGFNKTLMKYINNGGMVIGVSAGSLIFTNNLDNNLGLLDTHLSVHSSDGDKPGKLEFPLKESMNLSNTAAIIVKSVPDDCEVIDG